MRENYQRIYTRMHRAKADRFKGLSIMPHVDSIGLLIQETSSRTLLDFGCGKGAQYFEHRIHDVWHVPMPTLYDIGVPALSRLPPGPFDGVICTDVMEHKIGRAHV